MAEKIILAAIDLQHEASDGEVVEEAKLLAKSHNGTLHIVLVIPDAQNEYVQAYVPADMKSAVAKEAQTDLDKFASQFSGNGLNVETHVVRGVVYSEILKLAGQIKATAIVMGAHRPGLFDFHLGPNVARVARHAKCSVMIVRSAQNA